MAGVFLQDRDTPADLEQVSNSIQPIRICVVTRELTLESFRTELFSKTYLRKTLSLRQRLARANSDSNILATVEKTDWVDFLEEDCSTSTGFHDD
jgi:hypothetical protein